MKFQIILLLCVHSSFSQGFYRFTEIKTSDDKHVYAGASNNEIRIAKATRDGEAQWNHSIEIEYENYKSSDTDTVLQIKELKIFERTPSNNIMLCVVFAMSSGEIHTQIIDITTEGHLEEKSPSQSMLDYFSTSILKWNLLDTLHTECTDNGFLFIDKTLYTEDVLRKFSNENEQEWSVSLDSLFFDERKEQIVSLNDGTIVLSLRSKENKGALVILNSEGSIDKQLNFEKEISNFWILPNSNVLISFYSGNSNGQLQCYDFNGTFLWEENVPGLWNIWSLRSGSLLVVKYSAYLDSVLDEIVYSYFGKLYNLKGEEIPNLKPAAGPTIVPLNGESYYIIANNNSKLYISKSMSDYAHSWYQYVGDITDYNYRYWVASDEAIYVTKLVSTPKGSWPELKTRFIVLPTQYYQLEKEFSYTIENYDPQKSYSLLDAPEDISISNGTISWLPTQILTNTEAHLAIQGEMPDGSLDTVFVDLLMGNHDEPVKKMSLDRSNTPIIRHRNSEISIEHKQKINSPKLISLNGKIIKETNVSSKSVSLPINDVASGAYLLKFNSGNISYVRKIWR